MVLTGRGFWSFGPDVAVREKESSTTNNHFVSEEGRQQMAQDFSGEDGECRYAVKCEKNPA